MDLEFGKKEAEKESCTYKVEEHGKLKSASTALQLNRGALCRVIEARSAVRRRLSGRIYHTLQR